MAEQQLTEREEAVLDAVIQTYVETAEPAGSRTVAKRFGLGVSPATIRNAMADLEEKGFLYHPHTSAGRIPTDRAYRYYVDTLMRPVRLTVAEQRRMRREFTDVAEPLPDAIAGIVRRATQALGLITGELGVAIAQRMDDVVLEKLELALVASDRMLLVLTLGSGAVRTVYVDLPGTVPPSTLASVTAVLNERLAGHTLSQIRASLPDRLRDAGGDEASAELLNIFMQSAENVLSAEQDAREELLLGRASVLAGQPEFATGSELRSLIELTEQREILSEALMGRRHTDAPAITIGAEHDEPRLARFTLVTSEYRLGGLSGVVGVIGPTRMAYEKIAAIVQYSSALMNELANPPS